MGVLRKLFLLLPFLIFLLSCAKTSYLLEQGVGQVSLEWNGRDNKEVLKDPNVKKEHKEKIRLVEKAKTYFYSYFGFEESDIYDETTFLEGSAVTYLVIASPKYEIRAKRFSFPFYGSFPYLGFFSLESARERGKKLRLENNDIYIRPVYAYSTLDQWIFDDNILSSFFHYNNRDLVSLIFHELVHTIFFLDNDIEFNENFAEFISKKMVQEYFEDSEKDIAQLKDEQKKFSHLSSFIAKSAKELNSLYKKEGRQRVEAVQQSFVAQRFIPGLRRKCEKLAIKNCYPLRGKWNNARFAAFMTYEAKQNEIEIEFKGSKLTLKDFLYKIVDMSEQFKNRSSKKQSFLEFIKEN